MKGLLGCFGIGLAVLAALIGGGWAYDQGSRYWSWAGLNAETVEAKTQLYLDSRALNVSEITHICVYAVDCSQRFAVLERIDRLETYDFEALKSRIWDRKFDGVCTGRTANLGLHIVRDTRRPELKSSDHAYWSFYNGRFVPILGRFQGGSFSREPWQRCDAGNATYEVRNGHLYTPAREPK